ncbi:hypothetical protein AB1Y20_008081 [Prymnesium parvum]|uniref:Protein transport protein SEC23 n=1 Tax=Prymnesium parvum TaxID=97485 RepID=A0AB34ITD0_PRYPA
MAPAGRCGWVASAAPLRYSCLELPDEESSRVWKNSCFGPVRRYSSAQRALRSLSYSCGEGWNASRALRLLSGRTVLAVGDSMSLNLFCALSCAVAQTRGAVIRSSNLRGPIAGSHVFTIESAAFRSSWMLPSCAGGGRGRCMFGKEHGPATSCGAPILSQLRAAPVVVLHNPCGAYHNPLLAIAKAALLNRSIDELARQKRIFDVPPVDDGEARYSAASMAAAALLAAINSDRRNLAIMFETQPAHNPVLLGCLQSALRGVNAAVAQSIDASEWEGYVLGVLDQFFPVTTTIPDAPLLTTTSPPLPHHHHSIVHRGTASSPSVSVAPALRMVRQLLQRRRGRKMVARLGITTPSLLLKDTNLLARVVAFKRLADACEKPAAAEAEASARCAESYSSAALDCALKSVPHPRPSWRNGFHPGNATHHCEARRAPLSAEAAWRQLAERRAAAAHNVTLLRRSDAREARWDLHPGVQLISPHYLDCKHSSFAPGAFDAESIGFLQALEHRFGHEVV